VKPREASEQCASTGLIPDSPSSSQERAQNGKTAWNDLNINEAG
jgi:hypothetical protein